jgi:hypothetical protein
MSNKRGKLIGVREKEDLIVVPETQCYIVCLFITEYT